MTLFTIVFIVGLLSILFIGLLFIFIGSRRQKRKGGARPPIIKIVGYFIVFFYVLTFVLAIIGRKLMK